MLGLKNTIEPSPPDTGECSIMSCGDLRGDREYHDLDSVLWSRGARSILDGIVSMADFYTIPDFRTLPSVRDSLRNDWYVVGAEMRKAMARVLEEI